MSLLSINQLTVTYPDREKPVIRNLNLRIHQGERVLFLGASGSGKSTLALTLNGIIPYAVDADVQGSIEIDGVSIAELGTAHACQRIGMLFQDPETQFCMLHVEDEVAFGLENLCVPPEQMDSIIDRSLQKAGILQPKNSGIHAFSGGMKQKLGIACLYAMNPDIWIVDEPTANLDPANAEDVLKLIMELSHQMNKTILCIEHKLDLFAPYMDRVVVLGNSGDILCDMPPRELFRHRTDVLAEQGIGVPKICEAAQRLETSSGIAWNPFPLTLEEWEQGIKAACPLHNHSAEPFEKQQAVRSSEARSPAASQAQIEFENVGFSYPRQTVLAGVSFTVDEGDFLALVGPNGAGKSTLAQLMIKLLIPDHGIVRLAGRRMEELSDSHVFQQVGYVFQNPEHQFVKDTVEDELSYGYEVLGRSPASCKPRVDSLLRQFGLQEHRYSHPFQLSQGQKRRLSVATMLTHDQNILILDEPTFGQDHAYTEEIMNTLVQLHQQGKTIIMITHDMELVRQYADKVLLLAGGGLAFQGKTDDFFGFMQSRPDWQDEFKLRLPVTLRLEASLRAYLEVQRHA